MYRKKTNKQGNDKRVLKKAVKPSNNHHIYHHLPNSTAFVSLGTAFPSPTTDPGSDSFSLILWSADYIEEIL